jgi:hypothetical protein
VRTCWSSSPQGQRECTGAHSSVCGPARKRQCSACNVPLSRHNPWVEVKARRRLRELCCWLNEHHILIVKADRQEPLVFHRMSPATEIAEQILETAGKQPFAMITTSVIMAGRDRGSNTPVQARKFLDAVRGLFRWAARLSGKSTR